MGARRDFIRAMVFGVVIGVALTTAFFQLRGGTHTCPPATGAASGIREVSPRGEGEGGGGGGGASASEFGGDTVAPAPHP